MNFRSHLATCLFSTPFASMLGTWIFMYLSEYLIVLSIGIVQGLKLNLDITWYIVHIITFQSNRSRPINSLGFLSLAAATIPSPKGPHPDITTTWLNCMLPSSTAWIEQDSGSAKTAFQAGINLFTCVMNLRIKTKTNCADKIWASWENLLIASQLLYHLSYWSQLRKSFS